MHGTIFSDFGSVWLHVHIYYICGGMARMPRNFGGKLCIINNRINFETSAVFILFSWIEKNIYGEQKSLVKILLIAANIVWASEWKNPHVPSTWERLSVLHKKCLEWTEMDKLTDGVHKKNGSFHDVKVAKMLLCFVKYWNYRSDLKEPYFSQLWIMNKFLNLRRKMNHRNQF